MLKDRLAQLEMRYRNMVSLENSLKEFSEKYFSAVGQYASELNQLRGHQDNHRSTDNWQNDPAALPELNAFQQWANDKATNTTNNRNRQLKESYHKIAQRFHPDHHGDTQPEQAQQAANIMQQANEAYACQDMAALLRLEIEYLYSDADETATRGETHTLGEKLARCEALIGACILESEILQHSAIFTLHDRYLTAQLAGEDFIDNVVGHIKSQIAAESAKKTPENFLAALQSAA